MKARIQRLRAEIAADGRAIDRRFVELSAVDAESLAESAGARAITAVALHYLYGAIESVFERVARVLEGDPPAGANWHRALLEEMALELEDVRPAVISAEALLLLRELLGFRHFFRHAYAVELDPRKLAALREAALAVAQWWTADQQRLDDFLRRLAEAAD